MWFASPGGLICFDGEHWQTYNTAEDAPPVNVRTVFQDAGGVLWVGTSRGLARFDGHRIEVLHALPQALAEEILSIGQDAQGFLWIATDQHILQIDRTKLLAGTLENEDVLSYGAEDGLIETEGVRRHRSLVSDSSGRIWLSLPHSLAVADVQRAAGYRQPVRVRIDAAFPGSTAVLSSNNFNLSSNTRSITFRYAGTNTVTPQRIQFRYRLDGLDQTWSSGGSSRQVVYSHLAPGRYTFRMMASNALGAWNGPENDIMFYVQPAWWQTWFVRVLGTFDVAVLVLLLYRFRLMQVTNRLNKRFRDRLAERARIAQDLHDTLLQGVISAAMQLDVAQDHVSEDSPARPMMGRALQLMRQVTNEGREALRGLRTIDNSVSLETALERLLNESEPPPSSERRVRVEGNTRLLNTAVFDEAYRIGREAWINAVAHAEAARTEITIEYGRRGLRLTVSDNGRGIEPDMLKAGREGHFGLAGMKERAESIGSVLTICSRMQAGTEIELRVPAAIAYPRTEPGKFHWPWWIRKHDANSEEGRQQPR
jgi:signal transduction histidine kinase